MSPLTYRLKTIFLIQLLRGHKLENLDEGLEKYIVEINNLKGVCTCWSCKGHEQHNTGHITLCFGEQEEIIFNQKIKPILRHNGLKVYIQDNLCIEEFLYREYEIRFPKDKLDESLHLLEIMLKEHLEYEEPVLFEGKEKIGRHTKNGKK